MSENMRDRTTDESAKREMTKQEIVQRVLRDLHVLTMRTLTQKDFDRNAAVSVRQLGSAYKEVLDVATGVRLCEWGANKSTNPVPQEVNTDRPNSTYSTRAHELLSR